MSHPLESSRSGVGYIASCESDDACVEPSTVEAVTHAHGLSPPVCLMPSPTGTSRTGASRVPGLPSAPSGLPKIVRASSCGDSVAVRSVRVLSAVGLGVGEARVEDGTSVRSPVLHPADPTAKVVAVSWRYRLRFMTHTFRPHLIIVREATLCVDSRYRRSPSGTRSEADLQTWCTRFARWRRDCLVVARYRSHTLDLQRKRGVGASRIPALIRCGEYPSERRKEPACLGSTAFLQRTSPNSDTRRPSHPSPSQ